MQRGPFTIVRVYTTLHVRVAVRVGTSSYAPSLGPELLKAVPRRRRRLTDSIIMMAHLLGALVFFLINLASTTQAQCTFETSMCGWTESGKNAWTRGKATPSSGTGASRAHGGKWF
eukprot:COSAG01_NODE_21836_length_882_cov_6.591315_2_plen_115_part_01